VRLLRTEVGRVPDTPLVCAAGGAHHGVRSGFRARPWVPPRRADAPALTGEGGSDGKETRRGRRIRQALPGSLPLKRS